MNKLFYDLISFYDSNFSHSFSNMLALLIFIFNKKDEIAESIVIKA